MKRPSESFPPITFKSSELVTIVEIPPPSNSEIKFDRLTNKSVCWNCCHNINNNCISQPVKFENVVFSSIGNFCSYACICRYIVDSNESSENIFSKLSILNLFVNMKSKVPGITVTPAPPRLALKMFGGPMDIEEYRNYHNDYLTLTNVEPIIKCIDLTIKNLAEDIKDVIGYKGKINFDSTKPDGAPRKLLDSNRIIDLGFDPKINLKDGLIKTYKDYLNT